MNGSTISAPSPVINFVGVSPDRTKEFQMELLMEKLRTKTSQYKTLAETSKAVRMTMLDKRWALDGMDRAILQKCLDSLQHRIKVCSLQSLVERLECLSRQLGLKFMVGASGVDLFISSDMFYLEILLEASGAVKDVKIHHEGKVEQQSCEELVSCITRGDFTDFTAQLEGLTAVYQLNAEKKVKCKAFSALAALETDLGTLAQLQAGLTDPLAQVHKSPIGLVHKRRGGHAMRLTYFVSPYEVARCPGGELTAEALAAGAGLSAQVLLESAAAHKLQIAPIVILPTRTQPNSGPMYAQLSVSNSTTLPARFVLKLSQPMPICGALLKMMAAAGESEGLATSSCSQEARPLLGLVAQHSTTTPINPHKGMFVTLPDQNQCYFLTETSGLEGSLVESVAFTHPRQVPALVARLRQQAVFNALIASCVRPNSKQDVENSVMVEVSALSWQHISVSLEQPGGGGLATLELSLPEGAAPRVELHGTSAGPGGGAAAVERLGRALGRTLSVPVLVRALLARWECDARSGFRAGAGGPDPGGAPPSPRYPPHPHQGNFLSDSQQNLFGNQDSNLASIMGTGTGLGIQHSQASTHSMPLPHQQAQPEEKKAKKRKADADGEAWVASSITKKIKTPVHCEVLLESSSSSSDTAEESEAEEEDNVASNSSNDEEDEPMASPTSQVGFVSDLELSALDPNEFIGGSSNDNRTSCSEMENSGDGEMNDLQDMDDILRSSNASSKSESKKHKQKSRDQRSSSGSKLRASSLLMELAEGAGLMPPAVSITPVSPASAAGGPGSSPSFSSVLSNMCLDRPGIEIIPISTNPQTSLPSSITITPITSSQAKSMDERHRSDRKSSSTGSSKSSRSSSSDRSKDKKKKKRREDSMGPPEKLPPKQDPLTKPVSVSIKPTDGSHSPLSIRSSSPNTLIRKFSPSPTHGRSVSITKTSSSGTPSSSSMKSIGKPSGSSSHHSSPRHSPVQCSPKHTLSGYSSPKNHGTSSPKHSSSSGSSGKPSMSTLKSAASGSPSGKSGNSGYELSKLSKLSSGKESSSGSSNSSSRDKDRKSSSGLTYNSSGSSSPKLKTSSVKLKQLDLSVSISDVHAMSLADNLVSPGLDLNKSATSNQSRNRKGSLSAVIDKLKSAQHCGSETEITPSKSSSSSSSSNKERTGTSSNKVTDSKTSSMSGSSKLDSSKTQEYMVKPSSDGMKITINKTRMKDSNSGSSKSSSFSSNSTSSSGSSGGSTSTTKQSSTTSIQSTTGTGSPKTHTGLKPGVISGPASKKPQVMQTTKTGTTSNSAGTSSTASGSPGLSSSKSSSGSLGLSSGSSKVPFTKTTSSSSLSGSTVPKSSSSKTSTGSPKMSSSATDLSKVSRDREREREREREKSRNIKSSSMSGSSSDKSIFSSSKSERRSSPAPMRDEIDGERAFKILAQHSKDQGFLVEGFMKSLDTSKYQIPKLSARVPSDDPSKAKSSPGSDKTSIQNLSQSDLSNQGSRSSLTESPAKMMDYMGRPQDLMGSKYSFQHLSAAKIPDPAQKSQSPVSNFKPVLNLSSTSPKLQSNPLPLLMSSKSSDTIDNLQPTNFSFSGLSKSQSDSSKDLKLEAKPLDVSSRQNIGQQIHSGSGNSRDEIISVPKIDYSKPYPAISVCSAETINQSIVKQLEAHSNKGFTVPSMKPTTEESRKMLGLSCELGMKPPPSMVKVPPPSSQEAAEMLLDFSSSSGSKSNDMKNKLNAVVGMRRHTPPLVSLPQAPSLSVHIVKSPAPSPLIIPSPHSNSPCITDDELMDEAVVGPGK